MTAEAILTLADFRDLLLALDDKRSAPETLSLVNIDNPRGILSRGDLDKFKSQIHSIFVDREIYQISWSTFVVKWSEADDSRRYDEIESRYATSELNLLTATKRFDVGGSLIKLWNEFECESRKRFSSYGREAE